MSEERKKIVFLCSGNGGTLKFIQHCSSLGLIGNCEVSAVICDRECEAAEYAKRSNIPLFFGYFSSESQIELREQLENLKADIIVTTVHKILKKEITKSFPNRLVNVHYSLLPAFGGSIGTQSVKSAIRYGVNIIGATTHFVDESLDGGLPLAQAAIPLKNGENFSEELMNIVFRAACLTLYSSLNSILHCNEKIDIEKLSAVSIIGRTCLMSPPVPYRPEFSANEFWETIAQKN
jgi:phosphoribosylglycinamide formyltransferase-1